MGRSVEDFEMVEPGWYVRQEPTAGICKERDGQWWLYQGETDRPMRDGQPYPTLKAAVVAARA